MKPIWPLVLLIEVFFSTGCSKTYQEAEQDKKPQENLSQTPTDEVSSLEEISQVPAASILWQEGANWRTAQTELTEEGEGKFSFTLPQSIPETLMVRTE